MAGLVASCSSTMPRKLIDAAVSGRGKRTKRSCRPLLAPRVDANKACRKCEMRPAHRSVLQSNTEVRAAATKRPAGVMRHKSVTKGERAKVGATPLS